MEQAIIKLLAEAAGVNYELIYGNLHLREDLFLDENDIDEILNELENSFSVQFDEYEEEFEYVDDLVSYVKHSF